MYKLRFLAMIMKQNIGFYIISRLGAGYPYETGQRTHCDTESYSAEEGHLFFSILGLEHLIDENILNFSSFTQTCLFPVSTTRWQKLLSHGQTPRETRGI